MRRAARGVDRLPAIGCRRAGRRAARYGKPLVLTEFGADAIPGYRVADPALWSENYQAYFLERTLATPGGPSWQCSKAS